MEIARLLRECRECSGLTQAELAGRAGTSQPAIAAYETGARVPTIRTMRRLTEAAGCELEIVARLRRGSPRVLGAPHTPRRPRRGFLERPVAVPPDITTRPGPPPGGRLRLPPDIWWSGPPRDFDMGERRQRAVVYQLVLTEGTEHDVRRYVDFDTLVDLWPDLVLPHRVYDAWAPLVEGAQAQAC